MNNKIFFPQVNGILHGSDYNPDQWLDRPDILEKDIELMKKAKKDAMVQHCLPAHRGEEITDEVFEAHAVEIFDEAENRLHAQKAVMATLMSR